MDDRFMNELRRDPDSKFARSLGEKLGRQPMPRAMRALRPVPAVALATVAAAVVALFLFPEARVSAQAMLDLFRIRKFSAVSFDESRMEKLKSLGEDRALVVFDRKEITRDAGPPQTFLSPIEAAAAAGFPARTVGYLPGGLLADTVRVEGASSARLSVSEEQLRSLLEALDLRDVSVPMGLDGQVIEVRKGPVMVQQFRNGNRRAALVQARSPEVSVPAGVDLPRLAEVGLRVLGLDPTEARRVAQNTDWRSTLVVPVPMNASTFQQVSIQGAQGLVVTSRSMPGADGARRREGTIVLWSQGDEVFGLLGNLSAEDLLAMAESVR